MNAKEINQMIEDQCLNDGRFAIDLFIVKDGVKLVKTQFQTLKFEDSNKHQLWLVYAGRYGVKIDFKPITNYEFNRRHGKRELTLFLA